jgi:uncharacterized protein YecE (DUF72 family)
VCDGLHRALDSLQRSPTVGSGPGDRERLLPRLQRLWVHLSRNPMAAPIPNALPRSIDAGDVRIGISGWRYVPWRGAFYPRGLVQRAELAHASRQLSTIEINGSFYSLQQPSSWGRWFDETPDDFIFSVKGPRFITHMKKLREIDAPMANFFASGVLRLGRKLGPVLWQFPPNFGFDPATFEPFLATLPFNTDQALCIAEHHDHRVAGRTWLEIDAVRRIRHAVEVRHPSFVDPDFIALLRQYGVAFVVADTSGLWPEKDDVSADFVYVRLHGSETLYQSAYTDAELDRWAARIAAWRSGGQAADARLIASRPPSRRRRRDVYCYFDNTDKLQAPIDAKRLIERLQSNPERIDEGPRTPSTASRHRMTPPARDERARID